MKKISLLLLCLTLIQCQGQKEKEITKNEPMKEYKYKTDKRPLYVIGLNVPGPYELYINDIAAEKEYSPGMHNLGVDINPYVLKSGKYKFKLRVFPMPSELEKGGIQPHTAASIKVSFDTGEKNDKEGLRAKPGSYKLLMQYPVPVINKPVPFLDIEGEFEVELPYELEGWSKGQDLSKMDKKVLEEKVIKYYEKLRNTLNDGNVDDWLKKEEKRRDETYIFNYTSSKEAKLTSQNNLEKISENAKNNMQKVENYQFIFYAQSRIVSLERMDKENKGEGVLRTLEPDGAVRIYNVKLYLPEGSDEFVIIRK